MPVEFALRPRIRLREEAAPARRARPRLPKFALPALIYWLVIGGLVYEFVRHHEPSALPEAEAALAPIAPAPPATVRPWWRPLPAPVAPEPSPPMGEPPTTAPNASAAVEAIASIEAPLPEPEPEPEPPAAEPPFRSRAHTLEPTRARTRPRSRLAESEPMNWPVPSLSLPSTPTPASAPAAALAPAAPALAPAPAAALAPVASGLPSCEAALASASQDVDFTGGNRSADLPTQAIAAVLENGAWLSSCAVPEHTALEVCVAIKGGRVVGASVASQPADSALNQCVKRRASSLQFPYSPHLDLARTRF